MVVRAASILATGIVLVLAGVLGAGALRGDDEPGSHATLPAAPGQAREAEDHSARGLDEAEHAARVFLASYLPLVYGRRGASAHALRRAAPRVIAQLLAQPGRVSALQAAQRPRIVQAGVVAAGPASALATARIRESPSRLVYALVLRLARDIRAGWVVTGFGTG